ncbi:hypothetical protein JCM6882_009198 [Rhodosporidiobolus microsporus]
MPQHHRGQSRPIMHPQAVHRPIPVSLGTGLNLAILCDLYRMAYHEAAGFKEKTEDIIVYGFTALAAHAADWESYSGGDNRAWDLICRAFLHANELRVDLMVHLTSEEIAHGISYANLNNRLQNGHSMLLAQHRIQATSSWLETPVHALKGKPPLVHLQPPRLHSYLLYPLTSPHHGQNRAIPNYRTLEINHTAFAQRGSSVADFRAPGLHVLVLQFLHDTLYPHVESQEHLAFFALFILYAHERHLRANNEAASPPLHIGVEALYDGSPAEGTQLLSKETFKHMWWKGRLDCWGEEKGRAEWVKKQAEWHLEDVVGLKRGTFTADQLEETVEEYRECLRRAVLLVGFALGETEVDRVRPKPESPMSSHMTDESRSPIGSPMSFASPPPEARQHSLAKRMNACTPQARAAFA